MKKADTNNLAIVLAVVGSVIVLAIMLAWLRNYFFTVRNDVVYQTVLSAQNPKLEEIRARDTGTLNSYGWVDKEKGIVRIPIERAMALEVQKARSDGGGE